MKTKIKEVLAIFSNLTNENMSDSQISEIAKGQALLEDLERDIDKKSDEITQLKKEKIGFIKRVGAYKNDNTNNEENVEKSLDEIIEEVSQNFIKENKK